ncbi:MAG: hypothetical protein EHM39_09750 [Chloroflexi bacterium]|nr:MAG: hypothetical protein EHM39_09750 [Chloroflexota bacterium]
MTNGTGRSHILLEIDSTRCQVCKDCSAKRKCKHGAILIIDRGEAPILDLSRCWGCVVCVYACPSGAVVRREDGDHVE